MLREMLGIAEGILQDLHNDHREVDALIDEIIDSGDAQRRASLFDEVMTKLLAHAHAEERVLYARLEKSQDEEARSFALHGENEHQHVEQQLKQMKQEGPGTDERWTAQLAGLRDLVEDHVKEEESTGFSAARDVFDRAELERMSEEFQTEKARLIVSG